MGVDSNGCSVYFPVTLFPEFKSHPNQRPITMINIELARSFPPPHELPYNWFGWEIAEGIALWLFSAWSVLTAARFHG